jgi:O-antigen/teichoic acid export membrane protein
LLKNSAIYFAGRFGASLIVLLTVSIYTRLLSPAEYGIYALVVSGAAMAYAACMQWLTFSLSRFLPAFRDREEVILSHVAAGFITVASIIFLAALVLVPWLTTAAGLRQIVILGVAFLLAMSFSELNLTVFQMQLKPLLYVRFALLRVTAAAVVGVALAYYGWGAIGLVSGLIVGNLCIILPSLARNWRRVRPALLQRRLFLDLAAYGIPFAMTGALGSLINVCDRYIITALIGASAAGLYAAPYDLAMRSVHVLMMVVAMACNPLIFRIYEADGRTAVEPLIRRQVQLLLGVALPAAIAFIMLCPVITRIFLGEAFQQSARELIPWVVTATVLQGFQAFYLALSFSLTKQPLRQTGVLAIGAITNIGLNFALIPSFGLIGAALATVAAYLLVLIGSFLIGRRLFPLPFPSSDVWKIVAACGALAVVLWPATSMTAILPALLYGSLGAVAYLGVIYGLDAANARALFNRIWQRLRAAATRRRDASLERH